MVNGPLYRRQNSILGEPDGGRSDHCEGTDMEIFIGTIPYDASIQELTGLLERYGRVDRIHLPVDGTGHPSPTFATQGVLHT